MFTGIIEELGQVTAIDINGQNRRLTVASSKLVKELKQGDSISVSGVCLTAVDISSNSFTCDLAQETWRRTSFSRLKPKARSTLNCPCGPMGDSTDTWCKGTLTASAP